MGGYVLVLLGISFCEGKVVHFVGSFNVANNPSASSHQWEAYRWLQKGLDARRE